MASTWTDLLARHPVIRRARAQRFVELEKKNLIRHLEATDTFSADDLDAMRAPGPRAIAQLLPLNLRVAELLERIAQIETGFTPARRQEMLDGLFSFLEEATGLPDEFIRGLFVDIQWTSASLPDVIAGGGLTSPVRKTRLGDVQTPERRRLLALVGKRLTHDLMIHGKSLRFFYQALPLLRDTIDRGHPGLTNLYIGFAASLQLMMMLYDGPYPDGAAVRAGWVEVAIQQKSFRIRVSGINFPSLFNEIVKGLFEALLHPGMPTAEELGGDEAIFRELTAGPDLEYQLQTVAPEVSARLHRVFLALANRHGERIRRALSRAGHDDLTPVGQVSMLVRAFAQLDPRSTALVASRAVEGPLSPRLEERLMRQLIPYLET